MNMREETMRIINSLNNWKSQGSDGILEEII